MSTLLAMQDAPLSLRAAATAAVFFAFETMRDKDQVPKWDSLRRIMSKRFVCMCVCFFCVWPFAHDSFLIPLCFCPFAFAPCFCPLFLPLARASFPMPSYSCPCVSTAGARLPAGCRSLLSQMSAFNARRWLSRHACLLPLVDPFLQLSIAGASEGSKVRVARACNALHL